MCLLVFIVKMELENSQVNAVMLSDKDQQQYSAQSSLYGWVLCQIWNLVTNLGVCES